MIAFLIATLEVLSSIIIDIIGFNIISKAYKEKNNLLFYAVLILVIFVLSIVISSIYFLNIGLSIIEIVAFYLYFCVIKKYNYKLILGASLIVSLTDLVGEIAIITIKVLFPTINLNKFGLTEVINIVINALGLLLIYRYKDNIRLLLTNKNSSIFVGLLLYIYLTGCIISYYLLDKTRTLELVQVCLIMLVLQTIFAILIYYEVIRTQNNILTKQQQKQLRSENAQLKEYSEYLDKNEDELRRFKHDYQNILNSLIVSVKNDDKDQIIKNLERYTNTQFDQKALRKYKGVNHIFVAELKSITIAKLAKLYDLKINYSFGCPKEIHNVPRSIDLLDLTRVIGITFDNAIEESQSLIDQTGDLNSAKVDIMYFQENGDFEYTIKNKVRESKIEIDKITQADYTTKKHHRGLGLSNVERIADKYLDQMIINYFVKDGYFTFKLVIFSDEERDNFDE